MKLIIEMAKQNNAVTQQTDRLRGEFYCFLTAKVYVGLFVRKPPRGLIR